MIAAFVAIVETLDNAVDAAAAVVVVVVVAAGKSDCLHLWQQTADFRWYLSPSMMSSSVDKAHSSFVANEEQASFQEGERLVVAAGSTEDLRLVVGIPT